MIGTQVSHYIIESELGRGGMGVVYKARDTTLDRTVALKFLPPMIGADENMEARFINEAKAVSALDHPNIAVVHEIDRTDDGQLFIVMACYEGQTLEEKIEEGQASIEEVVEVASQIASGLQRAHDTGIIHRDIKPGNVIITEHGDAKILDFGLAKVQNLTLTVGAHSLGTLAYMSPEQSRGGDLDHRTDLWALGVVMYEMIAGRRPFDGPYDAAILYAASNEAHEPLTTWRPDVPEYLDELVTRLLEKTPERRIQRASEVVATLKQQQVPTASQIEAVTPDVVDTPAEPVSKTPSASSLTINFDTAPLAQKPWIWISMVGVIAVLSLIWIFGLPSTGGTGDADREAARVHLEAGIDHQRVSEFSLAEVEYQRAIDRDPSLWSAWTSWSSVKNVLGEHDLAIAYARNALALNQADQVAHFNLGIGLVDSGNPAEGLEAFEAAVRADGNFIAAYSAWGNTLIAETLYQDAIDVLLRGHEAAPSIDPNLFLIYRNLGFAYTGLNQPDDAILNFESSLQLQSGQPTVVAGLAVQLEATGDAQSAIEQWNSYLGMETDPLKRRDAQQAIDRLQ